MNDGRIEQLGEPLALYDRPLNLFVAQFIGSPSMNLLDGTLRRGEGRVWVETAGAAWQLPAASAGNHAQPVKVGVRPEHLVLDAAGTVACEIVVVEPMGAETEFVVQAGAATLTVVTHGRPNVRPGDKVSLAPDAAHLHLFDASTGLRL
jgi:multiple sugar transport system ATP-binding protein